MYYVRIKYINQNTKSRRKYTYLVDSGIHVSPGDTVCVPVGATYEKKKAFVTDARIENTAPPDIQIKKIYGLCNECGLCMPGRHADNTYHDYNSTDSSYAHPSQKQSGSITEYWGCIVWIIIGIVLLISILR